MRCPWGYEDFTIQDLRIEPRVVRLRRERWLTPDGRTERITKRGLGCRLHEVGAPATNT